MGGRPALIVLAAAAAACGRSQDAAVDRRGTGPAHAGLTRERYDVLLVLLDGARRDSLRPYGGEQDPMPALSALAAEAVVFEDAVAASTGALSAVASLVTGLAPESHGLGSVHDLGQTRLPASLATLAEGFADAGYGTLGAFASPILSQELSGLGRGFERVVEPGLYAPRALTARELHYRLRPELLERLHDPRPLFLCVTFADAGSEQPAEGADGSAFLAQRLEPFRERRADVAQALDRLASTPERVLAELDTVLARSRGTPEQDAWRTALHDGNLRHVDRYLEALLDLLRSAGRLEHAVVVVGGTRGRAFTAERRTAGPDFPAAIVAVPLIVRVPGARPRREGAPVSALDLAPALRELCALEPLARADGRSWLDLLEGRARADLPRACVTASLERRAVFGRRLALEERLSDGPRLFDRSSGEALFDSAFVESSAAELAALRQELARGERRELCLLRHAGSEQADLAVEWRFLRGHSLGVEAHGPQAHVQRDTALAGSARMGAGEGRLEIRGARRGLPLSLRLRDARGLALEERTWVGEESLARHPLPRVPSAFERPWPASEEGPAPWRADFEHAGDRWWRLTIPGGGEQARVLLARHPPERVDERLPVSASAGRVEPVPGRSDAVWVVAPLPLSIDIEKTPAEGLALSVEIDGRQVPVAAMRWRGRRFCPPGELELYLPDWMAGVSDALDRRGADGTLVERSLAADELQLLRRTSGMAPEDRTPLDPDALRVVRFLPADE